MPTSIQILIRVTLACILGGLIGLERGKTRHPAGLRTHILVCIGSTLVILCNLFIFEEYKFVANIDPARLGAQVISGIGFLGAGTILKEGVTVKGLTTAASLWAVACIGIAVGLGFYVGALLTTMFVLVTLILFSRFEHLVYSKSNELILKIKTDGKSGNIEKIGLSFREFGAEVVNVSIEKIEEGNSFIKLKAINYKRKPITDILEKLSNMEGIISVDICE